MNAAEARDLAHAELQAGIELTKCQQCGCMRDTLEALYTTTPNDQPDIRELVFQATTWLGRMAAVRYACLGCAHCYPAVALNALAEAGLVEGAGLACAFETTDQRWPVVAGDYAALCNGPDCPVAVSTLASTSLVDELARLHPTGLCIVGKTETENIGVDKVVRNVVTNPSIRYLIVAGRDPDGHRSGQTLLALANNGVDEQMRVVGSVGKRPILRNVTRDEVDSFRHQVQVVDLVSCEDAEKVVARIQQLAATGSSTQTETCTCGSTCSTPENRAPVIPVAARSPDRIEMDRAGYFVIILDAQRHVIVVEHYAYDNQLQHVIEGTTSRDLYSTIIGGGWVSQLSHAAYLGKELTKAAISLKQGLAYVQDSD